MKKPISRVDGWTTCRRARFLTDLALGGSVTAAARAAGMSRESAHRLRARDPGFAAGWNAAGAEVAARIAAEADAIAARIERAADEAEQAELRGIPLADPRLAGYARLRGRDADRWLIRKLGGQRMTTIRDGAR